eukprot:1161373-Pelagomonas_calceolata.AAC.6
MGADRGQDAVAAAAAAAAVEQMPVGAAQLLLLLLLLLLCRFTHRLLRLYGTPAHGRNCITQNALQAHCKAGHPTAPAPPHFLLPLLQRLWLLLAPCSCAVCRRGGQCPRGGRCWKAHRACLFHAHIPNVIHSAAMAWRMWRC